MVVRGAYVENVNSFKVGVPHVGFSRDTIAGGSGFFDISANIKVDVLPKI